MARAALERARREGAALIVCFIRSVRISYNWERGLTMDTDLAAMRDAMVALSANPEKINPLIPAEIQNEA